MFNVGGTIVILISKLQNIVAHSTMEAKYVATTKSSKEMIWLQRFMDELDKKEEMGRLYNDIHSAMHLVNNSTFHSKTKHIQLKYHYIWSVLEDG